MTATITVKTQIYKQIMTFTKNGGFH